MEAEPLEAEPPRSERRWFQFSLRTLLVFTKVVAVACGWLRRWIEQKRKEQDAVEAILKNGGSALYDYQFDPSVRTKLPPKAEPIGPNWLRNLFGENLFSEVVGVVFDKKGVAATDAGLKHLKDLIHLQS